MPIAKFKLDLDWKLHIIDLIVVIIGVTIAFGISSAAEKRKGQKEVATILAAMSNEILQDIDIFESHQIPKNEQISADLEQLIDMIYEDSFPPDSLAHLIRGGIGNYNWLLSRTTYESIVQSGKLDLIGNNELKLYIRNTYEVRYSQTKYIMDQAKAIRNRIKLHLDNQVDLRDDSSYLILAKDRKFKNLLSRYLVSLKSKVREYKTNAEVLKNLNKQIQTELAKK